MKSNFWHHNEFETFKLNLQKQWKDNSGTIIAAGQETVTLRSAIQKEISAFQQSGEMLRFSQRAIVINCEKKSPSRETLAESVEIFHSIASHWHIGKLENPSEKAPFSALDSIKRSAAVKAALKTRLIQMPGNIAVITAIVSVIVALPFIIFNVFFRDHAQMAPAASIKSIGIILGMWAVIGILTYLFARMIVFANPRNFSILMSKIRMEKGESSYNGFVSLLSNEITSHMPMAIILEDVALLDEFSSDVVKNLIGENQSHRVGALLWVVFQGTSSAKGNLPFTDCAFPVRRYSLEKPL